MPTGKQSSPARRRKAGKHEGSRSLARKSSRLKSEPNLPAPDEQTLTEKAYRQIEELIVTLALPPESVLSEQTLAARLGIGRTPIREALQRLARDGLVVILPRRGILVSQINLNTQMRLLEVRRELERLMARCAAERASAESIIRFSDIAREMRRAAQRSDELSFMRLDREFNELVSQSASNEFASRAMGLMHGLSRRFWYQHYRVAGDLKLSARLHANVAEAIASRDSSAASEASDQLLDYIESFTRNTL